MLLERKWHQRIVTKGDVKKQKNPLPNQQATDSFSFSVRCFSNRLLIATLSGRCCGLLVGILYEAPVAFGEGLHDDAVAFVHGMAHVFRPFALGDDGLVDDDAEGMAVDEVEAAHAGQDVETAVDGDGHHGQLQCVGELEGSAAEHSHMAGEGAGTLGEDAERGTAGEGLAGIRHRLQDGAARTLVDEDEACLAACHSDKGNVAQALLHHPFELVAQIAVDAEDVEGTLVVRHEDVALLGVDVLLALHADGDEEHTQQCPCPETADVFGGEDGESADGEQGYDDAGEAGEKQSQGQNDAELVGFVEE